jgi:hypothetical protein
MKKTSVLLTGFLLFAIVLHAQKKNQRFMAEISLGPSIPLGKFAGKSYKSIREEDQPAGLAKTGLNAQVALGYYLKENIGLLLMPGYSVHQQDESAYEDYLKQTIGARSGVTPSRVDVETKSWKVFKLMAGAFLVTPLTSELSFQTKLTAGACKTAIPGYSFNAYSPSGTWYAAGTTDNTSLSWAFCYQVSAGLKYNLNNKLHLLLDVNSFNATPKKEYTFYPGSNPRSPDPDKVTVKYKLAQVNVLAGVGLNF